jgi:hypothetical protein
MGKRSGKEDDDEEASGTVGGPIENGYIKMFIPPPSLRLM